MASFEKSDRFPELNARYGIAGACVAFIVFLTLGTSEAGETMDMWLGFALVVASGVAAWKAGLHVHFKAFPDLTPMQWIQHQGNVDHRARYRILDFAGKVDLLSPEIEDLRSQGWVVVQVFDDTVVLISNSDPDGDFDWDDSY